MSEIDAIVRLSAPLILAMYAGLFSERSGVINIALEGLMLFGAFFAASAAFSFQSSAIGLIAGVSASLVFALLYGLLAVVIKADQIVAGTSINMLAWGGIPFLSKIFFDATANTPSLGQANRLNSSMPLILVLLSTLVTYFLLKYSKFGLWLTFAGENPKALRSVGISEKWVRLGALAFTGVLTGLAGSLLSMGLSSSFTRNMTGGRGFMALAALILGKWDPLKGLFAALFFGLCEYLQLRLQDFEIIKTFISTQLLQALPYLVTLVILAGFVGKSRAPQALGRHV